MSEIARIEEEYYHDVFKDRFSVSKIGLCIINKHNDVECIGIEEIASSTKRVELVDTPGWSVVLEILRIRLLQSSTCVDDSLFAILTKRKKNYFSISTYEIITFVVYTSVSQITIETMLKS